MLKCHIYPPSGAIGEWPVSMFIHGLRRAIGPAEMTITPSCNYSQYDCLPVCSHSSVLLHTPPTMPDLHGVEFQQLPSLLDIHHYIYPFKSLSLQVVYDHRPIPRVYFVYISARRCTGLLRPQPRLMTPIMSIHTDPCRDYLYVFRGGPLMCTSWLSTSGTHLRITAAKSH